MIPTCNTTDGQFDCSSLLEGVPLPISIVQAIFAIIILVVSVFFNILLSVAIIIYRRFLDKSLIYYLLIMISNTATSVFFNGGVFLTTVSQTWLLGYWGCQVFGLIAIGGSFSRWILVGFLFVDRFCHVFYPFRYARQGNMILISLLVVSWATSLVFTGVYGYLGLIGFDISNPGCFIEANFLTLNGAQKAAVVIVLLFIVITGAVLPCILYIVIYRKLLNDEPVCDPATKGEPAALVKYSQQSKNTIRTLFGLCTTSFFFSLIIIAKISAKALLYMYSHDLSPAVYVSILYILSSLHRCLVIADFAVIMSNADVRKAFGKLKKAFTEKFKKH